MGVFSKIRELIRDFGALATVGSFLLLIGISNVVDFTSNFLQSAAEIILFIQPLLIFIIGIIVGRWSVGMVSLFTSPDFPDRLQGCISAEEVTWRVRAIIRNYTLSRIDVEDAPYCPECQTELVDFEDSNLSPSYGASHWWCQSCEDKFEAKETQEEVKRIAKRHFESLWTSNGEDYSIDVIVSELYSENGRNPTPKEIWEEYANRTADEKVSTECFH